MLLLEEKSMIATRKYLFYNGHTESQGLNESKTHHNALMVFGLNQSKNIICMDLSYFSEQQQRSGCRT
jgi:hypothetical protein